MNREKLKLVQPNIDMMQWGYWIMTHDYVPSPVWLGCDATNNFLIKSENERNFPEHHTESCSPEDKFYDNWAIWT